PRSKRRNRRKPGSLTRKTREVAERAVAEGIAPLEVVLRNMREADERGDVENAVKYAAMAAPYCHPRDCKLLRIAGLMVNRLSRKSSESPMCNEGRRARLAGGLLLLWRIQNTREIQMVAIDA